MIQANKRGAEIADKIAEIVRLRKCEAVRVAQRMEEISENLDTELRILREQERTGIKLIEEGIDLTALEEVNDRLLERDY